MMILSYLKIGAVFMIFVLIAAFVVHYNLLVEERNTLRDETRYLATQRDLAITTANDNAAAAKELEATYQTQIAALEVMAAETAVSEALSRTFADDLADAEDIEIPDALAKSFLKRFGGKP